MDFCDYVQSIGFRLAGPASPETRVVQLATSLLGKFGLRLDILNTRLPGDSRPMRRRLNRVRKYCPAGSFAVGALINKAVTELPAEESFLAVGIGDGFPLLAAMAGNPDKRCIGIDPDLLTKPSGLESHARFLRRFERVKSANHRLEARPFADCWAEPFETPIGFCFVGGGEREDGPGGGRGADTLARLEACQPRLAENAIVLVEDANCPRVRKAVMTFLSASRNQFRILLDEPTSHRGRLTFGNGILLFQLLGRNAEANRIPLRPATAAVATPAPATPAPATPQLVPAA